jgi:fumarate reductase flavoprotein subunit
MRQWANHPPRKDIASRYERQGEKTWCLALPFGHNKFLAGYGYAIGSQGVSMQKITKRDVLKLAGVGAGVSALGLSGCSNDKSTGYDVIIVGGGNSGLPAAIFAGQRGANVLIVDAAAEIGGTLFLSSGQMSAAGTKLQKSKGIEDTAQSHYDDIMRISKNTADPTLVKLAVFNAGETFDWLTDNGFTVREGHPVTGTTHEPYSHARYAWGPEGGMSILKVLEAQLKPLVDGGKVKVMTNTEVTELMTNAKGEVEGVVVKNDKGAVERIKGRNVVLTCGGYTYNPDMFEQLEGAKIYSQMTYPHSLGAGYKLSMSVGGYVRGGQNHTPLFGAIMADDDVPGPVRAMARHFPGDRPPWEILVNVDGKRFIQEDVLSHDVYEQGLRAQPDERAWFVFDSEIFKQAPPLVRGGMGGGWTAEDTVEALTTGDVKNFYRADSIKELAEKMKVDAVGLQQTIDDYNKAQKSGQDSFGRKHMPLPIVKAPFYGVQTQSWALTSYAGVAVNENLEVIKQDGKPIGNLYAAGELLGMGQMMGNSVCGGMSVTPALTLGRLLGQKILKLETKA